MGEIEQPRVEHVQNSNWKIRNDDCLDWLGSFTWKQLVSTIGMIIGAILLIMIAVSFCVIPLIRVPIKRSMQLAAGQFALRQSDSQENMSEDSDIKLDTSTVTNFISNQQR